jgi:hypothetical protein
MHGLAAHVEGRGVVVISKDQKQPAWLLFILAHELGHIALGHCRDEGEVLVDAEIDRGSRDREEEEANRFALELLTGDDEVSVVASRRWPAADELLRFTRRVGAENHIDPGFLVLNYAYSMGPSFWPVANAALNLMDPNPNAPALIRQKLAERLDWSRLPTEGSEFLMRITEAEVPVGA